MLEQIWCRMVISPLIKTKSRDKTGLLYHGRTHSQIIFIDPYIIQNLVGETLLFRSITFIRNASGIFFVRNENVLHL